MELSNVEVLPGVIDDANDPKHLGRVKATVPGLFNKQSIPEDVIPWINPMCMTSGYQSFSKLAKGTKIWVLINKDSSSEFWYIPMYEIQTAPQQWLDDNYSNNPEVLMWRTGLSTASLTYDDENGFIFKIGNNSWQMKPGGDFITINADGRIKSEGGHVYTGKDDADYEPAVMGNKLNSTLAELSKDLSKLGNAASSSPYTQTLTQPLLDASTKLSDALQTLLAENSSVN